MDGCLAKAVRLSIRFAIQLFIVIYVSCCLDDGEKSSNKVIWVKYTILNMSQVK